MSAEQSFIALDEPRWWRVLLDAVVDTPARALPRRRADLDREIHDALWSSGALLGASKEPLPSIGSSSAEIAYVQLTAMELRHAAGLIRSTIADPKRLRWMVGAVAAAFAGELGVGLLLDEAARTGELSPEDEERCFDVIGTQLPKRGYILGNPVDGLPLHAAFAVLHARAFVRFAAGHLTRPAFLEQRANAYLSRLSRLKGHFIELLSGVYQHADDLHPKALPAWRRGARNQLSALHLEHDDRRSARNGLTIARTARALLNDVPRTTRPLLVEQIVLAAILGQRWLPDVRDAFTKEAAVDRAILESAEARAAAFLLEHPNRDLSTPDRGNVLEIAALRARASLQETAAAVAQEIRGTGELGVLLTRQARGEVLTDAERHEIREQLIDLAKVVPSLAIFAAPGGMLLLPLLIKLLPFDLRPRAFQHRQTTPPPPSRPPTSKTG